MAGAEDALSEAFAAALAHWPREGVPASPEAWLLTAARRRLIDAQRQQRRQAAWAGQLAWLSDLLADAEAETPAVPDDRLALMFACAHPAIDRRVHAPLMLQLVLGFDAAAIASAFLVAPAAMGQRLVRAKSRLREAGVAFQLPGRAELPQRLGSVLDAIYAAFAEGWTDAAGSDARRRGLAEEALWLGALVASLLPSEAEAHGLVALMLHAEARRAARRDAQGRYVPLAEQDCARWNLTLIAEAEALLHRAAALRSPGRFQLEAAIQSAHAVRRHGRPVDWPAVLLLYDGLLACTGSPVVAINRAMAVAECQGPAAALAALEPLAGDPRLATYQPAWAARAELLARLGRLAEAREACARAAGLESDPAVRRHLLQRHAAMAGGG